MPTRNYIQKAGIKAGHSGRSLYWQLTNRTDKTLNGNAGRREEKGCWPGSENPL